MDRLRVSLLAALSLAALPGASLAQTSRGAARPVNAGFAQLAVGALASVELEPALYVEPPGRGRFLVRVRLVNPTPRPVGVELGASRWRTLYPNQWGGSDAPTRTAIDERRATVAPLTDPEKVALRAAFRRGALAVVPAHGSLDYYAEFNASVRADVDRQARRYVIVSMAGELRLTDGAAVEQLAFDFSPRAPGSTDLAVSAPVRWRTLPTSALVIRSP